MADDYDIGAAFEAIENELLDSMVRNLKRHRAKETAEGFQWSQWQAEQLAALEQFKRGSRKRYGGRFRSINARLEQILRDSYSDGQNDQEAAILEAIARGAELKRGGDTAFFRTNQRKLDALVKATLDDVKTAETAVLRRSNDAYRKIIFNAQVYANTGAGTYEKAVDIATKDFLANGIQCVVYANGARHTLADYAEMAIRTASKRAYLSGEGVKRQEWGVSTVILNKRSGACPQCARFCGKVFIDDVWSGGSRKDGNYPLLSRAIEQGLYHPRCKDSHTTWFPELHEDEKPYTQAEIDALEQAEQTEQRKQYVQRQAEKYRRLERGSLDPGNRRRYAARAAVWEGRASGQDGPRFTPAATLAEAQKYAREVLGLPQTTAYGLGIHLDVANGVNEAIARLGAQFGSLTQAGYLENIMLYTKKNGGYAAYHSGLHAVFLNPSARLKGAMKKMEQVAVTNFEGGAWSSGHPLHTVYHELGHAVGHMICDHHPGIRDQIHALYSRAFSDILGPKASWSMTDGEALRSGCAAAKAAGFSYYGLSSESEFVAEAIAQYFCGDPPGELARQVVEILMGGK